MLARAVHPWKTRYAILEREWPQDEVPDLEILKQTYPLGWLIDDFYTARGPYGVIEDWEAEVLERDMNPEQRLTYAVERAGWTLCQRCQHLFPATFMTSDAYIDAEE